MTQIQYVGIESLVLSPFNPRTEIHEEALAEMVESIREKGILYPLLVHSMEDDADHWGVIDGGMRLRALQEIGETDGGNPIEVPVIVRSLDISDGFVTNTVRSNMSVRDTLRIIKEMVRRGASHEQIANAVGWPERTVKQHLALVNVWPDIWQMYDEGLIDLEMMKVIARAHKEKQRQVWDEIGTALPETPTWELRDFLRDERMTPHSLEAKAAEKLGLVLEVEQDLFGNSRFIVNEDAVHKTVEKAMKDERKRLLKDEWFDVLTSAPEDGTPISAPVNQKAVDEYYEWLEQQDEDLDRDEDQRRYAEAYATAWTDAQKKVTTVVFFLDGQGEIRHRYYIVPDKQSEAVELGLLTDPGEQPAKSPEAADGWTRKAIERLRYIERSALVHQIATKPELALDLLAEALTHHHPSWFGIDVSFADHEPPENDPGLTGLKPLGTIKAGPEITKKERNLIIAEAVARSVLKNTDVVEQHGINPRTVWTPDEGWLSTLTKQLLIEIACEIGMGQDFIDFGKAKKADLVELLAHAFAGTLPNVFGDKRKAVYAKAKTWLPHALRPADEKEDSD